MQAKWWDHIFSGRYFSTSVWKIICSLLAFSIESQIRSYYNHNKTQHCIFLLVCMCVSTCVRIHFASTLYSSWNLTVLRPHHSDVSYPRYIIRKHSSHVHLWQGNRTLFISASPFPRICPTVFRTNVAAEWVNEWMMNVILKNKIRAQFKSLFISHMRCHISV